MISIATSYKNRKQQFLRTLQSIAQSTIDQFELIVVDDASDEDQRLEDLIEQYPFLRIIRVEPHEKWYVNPCVAFNKAFAEVKGDKVIIQNPECAHVGDVLKYVADNLTDGQYLSFSALSLSREDTATFQNTNTIPDCTRTVLKEGETGWYNHPTFRPVGYHFCCAITKKDLDRLGGFDERYAMGLCFDDDEFLVRIRRANLKIAFVTQPYVVHQWHYSTSVYQISNSNDLVAANRELLQVTQRELRINPNDQWQYNIPKILHLYWDMSPLSYLQLLTVKTFAHYNPSWQIWIHTPRHRHTGPNTWHTSEQKVLYYGQDYTEQLFSITNVTRHEVDLGKFNNVPEVFKSDILRWQLLSKHGGCWSDMDILYVKPISSLSFEGTMIVGTCEALDTSLCIRTDALSPTGNVHVIGFYLASPENKLFDIAAQSIERYFDPNNYQSVGSRMLMSLFPSVDSIRNQFPTHSISNTPSDIVYPYSDRQIDLLFSTTNHHLISSRTIGVHWYNGSNAAKIYANEFRRNSSDLRPCTISNLVNDFEQITA